MIKSVDMDTAERLRKLRCGHCGHAMTPIVHEARRSYRCAQKDCDYWSHVREDEVMEIARQAITALAAEGNLSAIISNHPTPANRYRDELVAASKQLEKVLDEEKQLARQLVAGRITDTLYDELAQELQARRTKAEASIREIEKKLQGVLDADRRTDRILDARKIGMNMLNHPDTQTANTWLHRHMRIVVWDRNAYKKMGMTSRFLVQFI